MKKGRKIFVMLCSLLLLIAGTSFADSLPPEEIYEDFIDVPPRDWEILSDNSVSEWVHGVTPDCSMGDCNAATVRHQGPGNYNTLLFSYPVGYGICDSYQYYAIRFEFYQSLSEISDACILTIEINQSLDENNREWFVLDSISSDDMEDESDYFNDYYYYSFDKTATDGYENNQPFEFGLRYSGLDCPFIAVDYLKMYCYNDDDDDTGSDDEDDDDDSDGCGC